MRQRMGGLHMNGRNPFLGGPCPKKELPTLKLMVQVDLGVGGEGQPWASHSPTRALNEPSKETENLRPTFTLRTPSDWFPFLTNRLLFKGFLMLPYISPRKIMPAKRKIAKQNK